MPSFYLTFALFDQMDHVFAMALDSQGRVHSDCLHWEGFPSILWSVLQSVGFQQPPHYYGRHPVENGLNVSHVQVTVPPHPDHPEWPSLDLEVSGHRLDDAFEVAALKVLTTFCRQHGDVIHLLPVGLFPAVDPEDIEWEGRLLDRSYLVEFYAPATIEFLLRCTKALYRLQALQQRGISELTEYGQASHIMINTRDDRITELEQQCEQRDTWINDRDVLLEDVQAQVAARDTTIANRNTLIAELQEQLHDMEIDLDEAHDNLDALHEQLHPPVDPPQEMDLDPAEPPPVQGDSGMDFEAATPPAPQVGSHSPASSGASVNNLDDY